MIAANVPKTIQPNPLFFITLALKSFWEPVRFIQEISDATNTN